jgi:hypothetical protein
MALAILQLDGVELRTTDRLTCRTLYRLMSTAVTPNDQAEMMDTPIRTARDGGDE